MLFKLRDYILREGVVSSQQLSRAFHVERSALQPMLDFWINKGIISTHQPKQVCQSPCPSCHVSPVVFYVSKH